ncbi:hypothetical protein KC19_4G140600 [Ceratodon purpureus]|uniref:Uncharacterized protein n=1 Tax=Ceratodon purpureus TaxID=3225 RepID=A0A8T0I8H0_CERPU|nr:hypothetical protein KC19_4G140600 [Ceratodon purpureus]
MLTEAQKHTSTSKTWRKPLITHFQLMITCKKFRSHSCSKRESKINSTSAKKKPRALEAADIQSTESTTFKTRTKHSQRKFATKNCQISELQNEIYLKQKR